MFIIGRLQLVDEFLLYTGNGKSIQNYMEDNGRIDLLNPILHPQLDTKEPSTKKTTDNSNTNKPAIRASNCNEKVASELQNPLSK